jgi:3-demethoxyubiquinol 3-hydroxylase
VELGRRVITALMGRQAIWICTAAVEAAVHRHLDDQLHFLKGRDEELAGIILSIREEELAHLHHAEAHLGAASLLSNALRRVVAWATDLVIWLSTWGDSTRMAKELRLTLTTERTAASDRSSPVSRFAD